MNEKDHNSVSPEKTAPTTEQESEKQENKKKLKNKTCPSSRGYCCEQVLSFYPLYDKEKE